MPLQSAKFRRSAQDHDRRRRLLADEYLTSDSHAGAAWPQDGPPEHRSANYGDAEFLDEQLRLTDLIPRRWGAVTLLFLAGAAAVGLLLAGYVWMPELALAEGRIEALDLASPASLARWLSALLLMAAAGAAVLVYSVRRHRCDDYQGRYRVWLWAAACLVLISADQAANLHATLQQGMIRATGTRLFGDGSVWWLLPYFFLLGAVGSRLAIDVWGNRLATALLLGGAACHGATLAAHFGLLVAPQPIEQVLLVEGARLTGNLLLFFAMLLHGRRVLLDAEGLLPRRERKWQAAAADEDGERPLPATSGVVRHVDPPHPAPQPILGYGGTARPAATTPAAFATSQKPAAAIQAAESSVHRKLTKAEKKALRQRLEQERLKREQQQRGNWK